MSVSKTHDPQKALLPLSLEDRISLNLEIIKDLARNPTFLPKPVDYDPNREILRGQMFSIMAKGVSISQLARAMAISNIYLQTIVKEGKALSKSQYDLVLASCRDLSEASGSRDLQPMPSLSPSPPQISEPPLGKEGEEEPKEAPPVPLKKRKTWRLLFMETAVESELSTTQQISRQMEELSASLKVLLDTVLINKGKQEFSNIACPYKGPDKQHLCSTCKLTSNLVSLEKSHLLQQIGALLEYAPVETLLKAFTRLVEKEELSFSEIKKAFSHLELAYISSECRIGEAIKLPGQKNPSKEVELYRIMESVIRSGLKHPLTQTIKQLWISDTPVFPKEEPVLIQECDKSLSSIVSSSLSSIFDSITQKRVQSKGKKDCRHGLSPSFIRLLSDLTITSLHALKNSTSGSIFLTQTPSGNMAIPKQVLQHVYGLILSVHPHWKVVITPCKMAIGSKETLSLSETEIQELLPPLRKFIELNHIQQTRIQYFGDLSSKSAPSPQLSETIDIGKLEKILTQATQTTLRDTKEEAKTSVKKHLKKTRHKEEVLTSSEERQYRNVSDSLNLLLESILQSKGHETITLTCPKQHASRQTCELCLLAHQVLAEKCCSLIQQIKELMEHTTKEKLLRSLMDLFPVKSLLELSKKQKFSNFEVACLVRCCGIGDEICCPGKLNPGSQVELYYTLKNIIHKGLKFPLTQSILEIWDSSVALPYFKQKDSLYISILTPEGSIEKCTYEHLENKLRPITQRLFSMKKEGTMRRRSVLSSMPSSYLKFVVSLTLFTAKALKDSPLGTPFLKKSSQETVLTEETLRHIYCVVLLSNPARKVVAIQSKASQEETEEFSLPETETALSYARLLKFARINQFFLAGGSRFNIAKNQSEEEEDE
ncbi:hypothetical protein [Chlamydiifrater volucris]|uniref:hypothetical protein n=1 Tax=Chlamydiifrater volucris TaxID=2681470 RepID=UPI0032B25CB9